MRCNHKVKLKKENSEAGFVLIVALIGIMILLAVGFFALTISTKDLMIASRLVGERKAFSAAESGLHAIGATYTEGMANQGWTQVDPVNDPYTYYNFFNNGEVPGMPQTCSGAFSIEGGITWSCKSFKGAITGKYDPPGLFNDSEAIIEIGLKGKASPNTPGYDFN